MPSIFLHCQHLFVFITIPLQFQSGVCSYSIFYKSEFGDLVHLITYVLPSNEALPHKLMLSLHPNQHFNLTIISYNSYGYCVFNTSVSKNLKLVNTYRLLALHFNSIFLYFCIGTHSVSAVNVSIASGAIIACIFNPGSQAIGCFINLTNVANGITYCITFQRFSNVTINNSIFQSCNATFNAGRYVFQVYDIERGGEISLFPAVVSVIHLITPAATNPSASRMPKFSIDVCKYNVIQFTFLASKLPPTSTNSRNLKDVYSITICYSHCAGVIDFFHAQIKLLHILFRMKVAILFSTFILSIELFIT